MALLQWLVSRAPDIDSPSPPTPQISGAPQRNPPDPGTADAEEDMQADEAGEITLDEIFCIIDYTDAAGKLSRRRVTLRKIARGPHAPILSAVCHERRAFRQFRCDRIECVIDADGVVLPCKDYFRDELLIDLDALAPSAKDLAMPAAREIREHLRPALSLLVTAAICDGEFHIEELDAICQYVETELFKSERCQHLSTDITIEVVDNLTDMIRKMRPQRDSLPGYFIELMDTSEEDFARFERALEHVIVADGVIDPAEQELLQEIGSLKSAIARQQEQGWEEALSTQHHHAASSSSA